jgi:NADH-quinone oxidoreductase subunit N
MIIKFFKDFNNEFLFIIPELYFLIGFFIIIFFFSIIKLNIHLKKISIIISTFNNLVLYFLFNLYILFFLDFIEFKNNIYIYNFFFKKTTFFLFGSLFLILILFIYILFLQKYNTLNNLNNYSFEYTIIILFAVLGFVILFVVNDFLLFYITFEIASLSLYVLISFNVQSNIAINSGLKYYILGAISSSIILLGISFLYGITGLTNFNDIINLLYFINIDTLYGKILIISIIFIFIGLFFKLGLFPFHFWLPFIYSGVSFKTILFLFLIPKISFIFIFINFYINIFFDLSIYINNFLILFCIISILIGTFGAIMQNNIKKLLAFSSIVNLGYIILILTTITNYSIIYALTYCIIYFINLFSFFFIILITKKILGFQELNLIYISQLSNIFKINPLFAFIISIIIFSIAGLPPFGGFYTKYFILLDLINTKSYLIVLFILLLSVISTFYYIRIIKIIFFNKNLVLNKEYYFNFQNNTLLFNYKNKNFIFYSLILILILVVLNILICFYPSIIYYILFKVFF